MDVTTIDGKSLKAIKRRKYPDMGGTKRVNLWNEERTDEILVKLRALPGFSTLSDDQLVRRAVFFAHQYLYERNAQGLTRCDVCRHHYQIETVSEAILRLEEQLRVFQQQGFVGVTAWKNTRAKKEKTPEEWFWGDDNHSLANQGKNG